MHGDFLCDLILCIVARLSQLSLSGTNKVRIFNWIMAGAVWFLAPLANINSVIVDLD